MMRGGRTILAAAYVDAVAGTVTGLVGLVGAGKTTLLEVLVGRARADRGQIRWQGERMGRPSLARLAGRGLCYLPDRPWIPGRLSVRAALTLAGGGRRPAEDVATELGLGFLLDARGSRLSTGERRLLEVAFALARGVRVVVADEPFRSLEPLHRERVGRAFARLAESGAAVLFADHDPRMVREFATRLFSIEGGYTRPIPDFQERSLHEWYHSWPGSA